MKKPTLVTIIVIIFIIVIGTYAMGEVNYYSSKQAIEVNKDYPVILIDKLGVNEKINNVSISQGVYHEEFSHLPEEGEVVIFGHRTLQGSPFLRLNEMTVGDIITLQWPGKGELNYTVTNSTIVPESYSMDALNDTQNIYLITCDPIGSTENRIIVKGNLTSTGEINTTVLQENPQQYYAIIIIGLFAVFGIILTYFYNKENQIYIGIAIGIMLLILIYYYFFPIDSDIIYSKINWLNGGFL